MNLINEIHYFQVFRNRQSKNHTLGQPVHLTTVLRSEERQKNFKMCKVSNTPSLRRTEEVGICIAICNF